MEGLLQLDQAQVFVRRVAVEEMRCGATRKMNPKTGVVRLGEEREQLDSADGRPAYISGR